MVFTKEEKTIFIIILSAVICGLLINLLSAYKTKITDVPVSSGPAVMDINTASAQDLDRLPGIGKIIAERIVQYRQAHGPFKSIGGLRGVKGITAKKLAAIEKYLTVGQ